MAKLENGHTFCTFRKIHAMLDEGKPDVVILATGAEKVATECGGLGIALDVTDVGSVERAVEQVTTELGPVDILVNCAGWERFKTFLETDEAFTAKVLEINLTGPIRMTRAVLPGMVERRWGRLIQIASDAGRPDEEARPPRRHRTGRSLPGFRRGGVHHRSDALGERRTDDVLKDFS